MSESNVTYEVTYLDQVNEGRTVWAEHEAYIETEAEAVETAKDVSSRHEFKAAKVYRVTREEIAAFNDGELRKTDE